jgi:hypothetical protein
MSKSTPKRTKELEQIRLALGKVMTSEAIGAWLQAPNPAFSGLTPIELIERGGGSPHLADAIRARVGNAGLSQRFFSKGKE